MSHRVRARVVRAIASTDESDVIGLDGFRSNPDRLEAYVDLCDELGV
ncbi:hypothetical protein ACIBO4_36230 [Streptomyces sp. NPDC050149]